MEASDTEVPAGERLAVLAAKDGDFAAFRHLYDSYVGALHSYIARRCRHEEAEDLTAEVFARAWKGLARYEWTGVPFGAWLFAIARNLLSSEGRRRRFDLQPLDGCDDTTQTRTDSFEDRLVDRLDSIELSRCIEGLPDRQRRVVELRFVSDHTVAEVAVVMDLTEEGVRALTYRALRTVRASLPTI